MSAEEALAREITARGPVGVASYRLVPREEFTDKDRVKLWFEKANIEGAVVLRLVATDKQKVYVAPDPELPAPGVGSSMGEKSRCGTPSMSQSDP